MSIDHGKLLALLSEVLPPRPLPGSIDSGSACSFTMSPLEIEQMHIRFDMLNSALAQPAEAVEGREPVVWRVPTKYGVGYSFASEEVMRELCGDDVAQGAVAEALSIIDRWMCGYDHSRNYTRSEHQSSEAWKQDRVRIEELLTHPQAAHAQGDGWRLCYSAVIHALAAIVNVRCPDKLFDLDAIPRGPVMDQVVLIREAMDRFGKVHAAAPSQEGES